MKRCNIPANEFNCGHETLYYVLSILYENRLSLSELYFLSEPFNFDILDDGLMVSYKTMKNIIMALNKNIKANIILKKYEKNSMNKIIEEVKSDKVVILFILSECLFYHNSEERCPYHMILINGIDLEKKIFNTIDLFVQNDNETISGAVDLEFDYLSRYILEYAIFTKESSKILENRDKSLIKRQIQIMCNKKIGPFNYIANFFEKILYEEDNIKIINGLVILKWMMIEPMFKLLLDYCKDKIEERLLIELNLMLIQWEKNIQKTIKLVLKGCLQTRYSEINNSELCDKSMKVIKEIYLEI